MYNILVVDDERIHREGLYAVGSIKWSGGNGDHE